MKLNNKGFALTSIVYMLIVLFLMLLLLILSNLATRKVVLDKLKYDVKTELGQGGVNSNGIVTITFDALGGELSNDSKLVEVGKTYGFLPIPTRVGYKFNGWCGKNILNYNNLLASAVNQDISVDQDGYISDTTPSVDDRSMCYENSNWKLRLEPGTYTISFDLSNASTNDSSELMVFDEYSNLIVLGSSIFNTTGSKIQFTLDEAKDIGIESKGFDAVYKIQLEKGSSITSWNPYQVFNSDTIVTDKTSHTLYALWDRVMAEDIYYDWSNCHDTQCMIDEIYYMLY